MYGYSLTELPKLSGTGMELLQKFQKFRVLWHRHTALTEVLRWYKILCTRTPGIVARVFLQNSQKFRVRL